MQKMKKYFRNTTFPVVLALCATFTFSLSSCSSEPRPQSPVMDEATFVDFLEQAYLLEGFYALESHYQLDTLQPEMIASYDSLLAQYGITHEVFDTTVDWYAHHPDIYQRVHDSVMARLTDPVE